VPARCVANPVPTQRLAPPVPNEDELALRAWLRAFATRRPRWGWRPAATCARREGWHVNNERVHRLWRLKVAEMAGLDP
jgi:putative transposase